MNEQAFFSASRAAEKAGNAVTAALARGILQGPEKALERASGFVTLALPPGERKRRLAAYRATCWRVYGFEPPAHVTRVVSRDGQTVAIRGAECWFEGPGHSNWAYVLVDGKPRTPGPDSKVIEDTGWYCWMDLDGRNEYWADDTANDTRPPATGSAGPTPAS